MEPEEIAAAYGVRSGGEEAERLNRIHEVEGASIARGVLLSLGCDPRVVERITRIIERHDSGRDAESLEEALVKDADKLWRFSEIGFWKEVERQGLEPAELHGFLSARYRGWFLTATALALAETELRKRTEEMERRPHPSRARQSR